MRRAHHHLAGALLETGEALAGPDIHALLAIVVDEEVREIGGKHPRADAVFGDEHGDIAAYQAERRRDFRTDKSATQYREAQFLVGERTESEIVVKGAVIDDLTGLHGEPAGRAAGGKQQLFVRDDVAAIIGDKFLLRVDGRRVSGQAQLDADLVGAAPHLFRIVAFPEAFREGRAVVRRMRVIGHDPDAATRIGLPDRPRGGVGSHTAADDQIANALHSVPARGCHSLKSRVTEFPAACAFGD